AKKGDWVRIRKIILKAGERSLNLPDDTKKVPLVMWDKGFLMDETASPGDWVKVETIIGRQIEGELEQVQPGYDVNYGESVNETLYIGKQLRELLGDGHE
ncbi:MAG: 2-amino-4-oxopentanoate thiolase subunit OrtA, partial [Clostridia bacterium]|nr:2-amino-4-oxopentanoate thiolase subunit OrtA [Clostridia bacterium]